MQRPTEVSNGTTSAPHGYQRGSDYLYAMKTEQSDFFSQHSRLSIHGFLRGKPAALDLGICYSRHASISLTQGSEVFPRHCAHSIGCLPPLFHLSFRGIGQKYPALGSGLCLFRSSLPLLSAFLCQEIRKWCCQINDFWRDERDISGGRQSLWSYAVVSVAVISRRMCRLCTLCCRSSRTVS